MTCHPGWLCTTELVDRLPQIMEENDVSLVKMGTLMERWEAFMRTDPDMDIPPPTKEDLDRDPFKYECRKQGQVLCLSGSRIEAESDCWTLRISSPPPEKKPSFWRSVISAPCEETLRFHEELVRILQGHGAVVKEDDQGYPIC